MGERNVTERFGDEMISPELPPLLFAVCDELGRRPVQLLALHSALEALLVFLASPSTRTNANCRATDYFFALETGCETSFDDLPETYQLIFDDLAMSLHDTITSPEIAANFYSTPEQLLACLRELPLPAANA